MEASKRLGVALLATLLLVAASPPADPLAGLPEWRVEEARAVALSQGISAEEQLRRDALRDKADDLVAYVNGHPDDFAGVQNYIGPGEWHLTIYAKRPDALPADLLPADVPVKVVTVDWSQSDLNAIAQGIVGRPGVEAIEPDQVTGRVIVRLSRPEQAQELRLLSPRIDILDSLPTVSNACSNDYTACTPWRGAIHTLAAHGTSGSNSTAAGWAKATGGSQRYFIISGHNAKTACNWTCAQLSVSHNNSSIGTLQDNATNNTRYKSGEWTDAGRVPSPGNSTQMNRIFSRVGDVSYPITQVKGIGTAAVNDPVCKSGIGNNPSFYKCGVVTRLDGNYTVNDPNGTAQLFSRIVYDLDIYDLFKNGLGGGDSGGPIYYSGKIYSMHVASSNLNDVGYGSYSKDVQVELDVRWCLNPDCSVTD
jgi:hypothetical protein